MCPASCQPTTRIDQTSTTEAKNTTPSQPRSYKKPPTHSRSGPAAVKSRFTRSGGRTAAGSGIVVRHGLPRRLAPWMPCGAHQTLDAITADTDAVAPQRQPRSAVAVAVKVGRLHTLDVLQQ